MHDVPSAGPRGVRPGDNTRPGGLREGFASLLAHTRQGRRGSRQGSDILAGSISLPGAPKSSRGSKVAKTHRT